MVTEAALELNNQNNLPDISVPSLAPSVPTEAPRTFYEFEKHANELHNDDFYKYMKVIPDNLNTMER